MPRAQCCAGSKDKEKDEDSFLLKMGSHVVKNLLVRVIKFCERLNFVWRYNVHHY